MARFGDGGVLVRREVKLGMLSSKSRIPMKEFLDTRMNNIFFFCEFFDSNPLRKPRKLRKPAKKTKRPVVFMTGLKFDPETQLHRPGS